MFASLVCAAADVFGARIEVPLEAYLEQGRVDGYNIIYASSLLRGTYRITTESGTGFSLETLSRQLPALGLELEAVGERAWVLRRRSEAAGTPAQAVEVSLPTLEEIVVHSSRYQWSRSSAAPTVLGGDDLVKRPLVGNDALRVVNQLPGSASVGISARPRVRGGREDETLVEFDDVRLYTPYHLTSYNSLYSAFDERVLGEVEFFSGAYPLSFGDGLSAVLSMTPPQAQAPARRREIGLGLYQLSYFQSVAQENDAWLVSLRRSGPESGELLEAQDLGHPEFADAFLRFQRDDASGRRWSMNLLWFGDDLGFGAQGGTEQADTRSSSGYGWGTLENEPGGALDWRFVAGGGWLDSRRQGIVTQPGKVQGSLKDDRRMWSLFANQDFSHSRDARELRWGWDYRYLDLSYEHASTRFIADAFADLSDLDRPPGVRLDGTERAHLAAAYAGATQQVGPRLFLDAELRVDAQHFDTRRDVEGSYRLGALYRASDALDLRIAWGRYVQAQPLHELPISDLDATIPPVQRAQQWVLGAQWTLPSTRASLRLEAYRKNAYAVNPYYANLANAYTLLPELQPDRLRVSADRYRAEGVELSLSLPFTWGEIWANYAYSSARDRVDGTSVARSWEQGRTMNAGVLGRVGRWELGLVTAFHEGWLGTPLGLVDGRVVAGARNSARLDHFFSLDVKAVRRWTFARQALRLELGLINLTNRENIVGIDYALQGAATLQQTPFPGVGRSAILDLYWSF